MSDRERERGGRGLAPRAGAPRDARNPACNEGRERHVRCAPRFVSGHPLSDTTFQDKLRRYDMFKTRRSANLSHATTRESNRRRSCARPKRRRARYWIHRRCAQWWRFFGDANRRTDWYPGGVRLAPGPLPRTAEVARGVHAEPADQCQDGGDRDRGGFHVRR